MSKAGQLWSYCCREEVEQPDSQQLSGMCGAGTE